jgi:hypothetical protein
VLKGNAVSGIVNPYGKYIGGPLRGDEGIVYADIDIDVMIDAKTLHDVVGHYNRFDVLSLQYNRKSPRPISFSGDGSDGVSKEELLTQLRSALRVLESEGRDADTPQIGQIRGLLSDHS